MNRNRRRLTQGAMLLLLFGSIVWEGSVSTLRAVTVGQVDQAANILQAAQQQLSARRESANSPVLPVPPLPEFADVAGTMQALEVASENTGVELTQLEPVPGVEPGKNSFKVIGTGAPAAVCGFLAAIEQHEPLIVVEAGSVTALDEQHVAFQIGLATFHGQGEGR